MDPERDSLRQTYQLSRLGFAILSVSLLLACFTSILTLVALFGGRSFAIWIVNMWWWRWIGTPIVWGCLIGTYLLWGRWPDPGWQRRVGLLVVMSLVDVDPLGLRPRRRAPVAGRRRRPPVAPQPPRRGAGVGRVCLAGQPGRRCDRPSRRRARPRGEQVDPLARRDRRGDLDASSSASAPTGTAAGRSRAPAGTRSRRCCSISARR